jgi:hypothetical protein
MTCLGIGHEYLMADIGHVVGGKLMSLSENEVSKNYLRII